MRTVLHKTPGITRSGDLCVVDLIKADGEITGAVAWHAGSGTPVVLSAKATIVATGGLTRLYRRNSASSNMGGDGYALCLRAGTPLIDMEFVQFFPIGHLAPRLIGMDPIMWDPFRYKLGGRLLNRDMQEFTGNYGVAEDGKYVITRDVGTYAIIKEVEAGRGSPHGGAYLSFQHVPEATLREAFGPVIDRLAANGIDLTQMPVEVAPIAHYHMGGVPTDVRMQTELPGLLVSGEAVGGANGANRLSGNAITEALVFGRQAGRTAVARVKATKAAPVRLDAARPAIDLIGSAGPKDAPNTAEMLQRLQAVMSDDVGPLRTRDGLVRALDCDRQDDARYRRAAVRRRRGVRHGAARLVRSAQHAAGRAYGRQGRAGAHRKPRRASARGSSRHAAGMARQPGGAAVGRRRRADIRAGHAGRGRRPMSETATLKIWRGQDKAKGHWETHAVPFERGQSVLDGLRWIRVHKDPTLAIRFSCINANACKECMMECDGETVYACTARLEAREMTIEPLSNKKLVRDLVTEIAPPAERFAVQGGSTGEPEK